MYNMARAIWTGTLQFVLISFPVKLYKATDDKGISFKNLHAICGSNINLKKWCNVCGIEVNSEQINKGYEVGKGQYVIFTEEEIDNILPENAKTIKIEAAVVADEIPVITYDTSYFMTPDKGGEHVYNLLLNALAIKGKVLIGRVVIRNKEHLVAIRPYQDGLLMSMLHFSEEVRDIHEIVYLQEKQVDKKELDLAISLMDHLTGSFRDLDQKDKFREYVEKMVEMKMEGKVITVEPTKPVKEVKSIIEGLQKSIEIVTGKPAIAQQPAIPPAIVETKIEEIPILKIPEPAEKKIGIKQELDKMYGVTEEEINKLILEQKIEEEQERLITLKEIADYKTFEDYVKSHKEELEGIEIGEDFKSITISDDTYPRIKLPILKKIGIVANNYGILIYIKSTNKEITGKKVTGEKVEDFFRF
jgi:DNA end-binding protein Ku